MNETEREPAKCEPISWWREIETHCSQHDGGKRWCSWCDVQVFPERKQHAAECPISKMISRATTGDEK